MPEGLKDGKAARHGAHVADFDLADYVTSRLRAVTSAVGQEEFPFSSTGGVSFDLITVQ